jgi:hypothetical protein
MQEHTVDPVQFQSCYRPRSIPTGNHICILFINQKRNVSEVSGVRSSSPNSWFLALRSLSEGGWGGLGQEYHARLITKD